MAQRCLSARLRLAAPQQFLLLCGTALALCAHPPTLLPPASYTGSTSLTSLQDTLNESHPMRQLEVTAVSFPVGIFPSSICTQDLAWVPFDWETGIHVYNIP